MIDRQGYKSIHLYQQIHSQGDITMYVQFQKGTVRDGYPGFLNSSTSDIWGQIILLGVEAGAVLGIVRCQRHLCSLCPRCQSTLLVTRHCQMALGKQYLPHTLILRRQLPCTLSLGTPFCPFSVKRAAIMRGLPKLTEGNVYW